MSISEDMKRVIRQRAQRGTLYSNVYRDVSIVSCEVSEKSTRMVISLPVIDQYVDHEGLISNAAMSHIIDTLPGILVMAIGKRTSATVSLNINTIGQARVGDNLSIQIDFERLQKSEFGNLEFEVTNKEDLISKGSLSIIFTNQLWAQEKI